MPESSLHRREGYSQYRAHSTGHTNCRGPSQPTHHSQSIGGDPPARLLAALLLYHVPNHPVLILLCSHWYTAIDLHTVMREGLVEGDEGGASGG